MSILSENGYFLFDFINKGRRESS